MEQLPWPRSATLQRVGSHKQMIPAAMFDLFVVIFLAIGAVLAAACGAITSKGLGLRYGFRRLVIDSALGIAGAPRPSGVLDSAKTNSDGAQLVHPLLG